ncbi:hypothetical protein DPMN_038778 [Dreissena polymorpha]|uniref:Uncharacterized protein n=1 Tax=Dreissena polymorpha TaxID=45954 RepID=A0A9D4MFY3_DREPO|nr:hypothetical protein DPMN_038778 [Dreissena polymorpha]
MSQSENEVLEYTANVLFSSSESEDSAEPKQCQQRKLKSEVKNCETSLNLGKMRLQQSFQPNFFPRGGFRGRYMPYGQAPAFNPRGFRGPMRGGPRGALNEGN